MREPTDRAIEGPRHLLRLRAQQKKGDGSTEFVPLPFVLTGSPIYLKGRARRGPIVRPPLGG